MDGILIIDKPVGPTSHDIVSSVRKILKQKKVGHTGTLDPAATGVLPLVIGQATKLARYVTGGDRHVGRGRHRFSGAPGQCDGRCSSRRGCEVRR